MFIATVIGNLGSDPELRYTPQGKPVCNLSVACNDYYNDQKTTTWAKCVIWGPDAENTSKFMKRGSQIAISGKVREREWQDKEGNKRKSFEVHAQQVQFLGSRAGQGGDAGNYGESQSNHNNYNNSQDVPF